MRIGIDARMYGPKQGGLGRYIEQLISHLEQIDDRNEYVIFLRRENRDAYSPTKPNFKKLIADVPWYGWREQLELPKIIRQTKVDLTHFPHWNVPLFYNDPFVVTIHDLLLLHYPTRESSALGPLSYWFKNLAFRKVLRHAVRKAEHIIAPSEFTKQDIHNALGVPLNQITTTYLAPWEPVSFRGTTQKSDESIGGGTEEFPRINADTTSQGNPSSYLLEMTQVNRPYALYVGVAYPHKNLNRLLDAWQLFQQKYGTNYHLVLVGKRNYFYNKLLSNETMKQCNNVTYTDYLPDSELTKIYSKASLYVFPSLYEGFGLPPLEAMQYNIPVISSNRACLPKILRDAALYFNPEKNEEIVEALYRGFTDNSLREKLICNAKKLLPSYSWEKTAQRTLDVYENSV
ncbi:MAG: mannosyltransferase B-like protein [Candidatus Magasanikbacteria bacterium GW2011_GWA2_46_17]|uniref:Mannosyltransferase B-like protein n=1 Tax=Candidatus Magasanikbacteria bacterium GW2011_GWA2_46_17 TaxID=1619042 RepID=A0A0G1RBC3_9BACT|nr:MAG: mannosyltransferase B-like protein [Candidatus Magasanikbacteria bacterium GW2011_GWA2_46_17]